MTHRPSYETMTDATSGRTFHQEKGFGGQAVLQLANYIAAYTLRLKVDA